MVHNAIGEVLADGAPPARAAWILLPHALVSNPPKQVRGQNRAQGELVGPGPVSCRHRLLLHLCQDELAIH